ncbi:hypothetical protein Acr_12g0004490 [Actinidia rufa]|uniref:Uncharacterized protein n=1 Tax=Actinidia rufa TaxID=165716 RepID=A0A7J0FGT2_9ERIC|nr:hypothetical protein Acr_12g0004490 [Actinidia rufa]
MPTQEQHLHSGAIDLQQPNSVKLRLPPFRSRLKADFPFPPSVRGGWYSIKGTVDATEEMWNKLYKINSKAKSFRKFGFPHYAAVTRVLGDNTTKGMNAFASTQSPSRTDSSDPELKIKEEADLQDLEVDNFKAGVKERGKAISKSRKRDSYSANLSASLNILAESSHGLSYFKAMTKLKEDPTRRRIFLGMPDKRKMDRCTSLP